MFSSRYPYSVYAVVGKLIIINRLLLSVPSWQFELFVSALTGSPAKAFELAP